MRKDDNVGYVNSKNIKTLSIKTTEQIDSKHLHNFIITSIKNNNIKLEQKSFYYYTFKKETLSYEIIVFNSFEIKEFIFEPFLLLGYYDIKNKQNSSDLFILDNFFALFVNQNFITYKKIQNVNLDDIKLYLTQTYNISIDNIININRLEFRQIRANYFINHHKHTLYKYIATKIDSSYKQFLFFVAFCGLVFTYLAFGKITNTDIKTTTISKVSGVDKHYLALKKEYLSFNKKPYEKTIELFKYLKLKKITILDFEYKDKKFDILIEHTRKENLMDFLTMYEEATIDSLIYIPATNKYQMKFNIMI